MNEPLNDLERAYAKSLRGPEGQPELFRQLRTSTVWFLIPYHPELEGTLELKSGDRMTFKVWEGKEGQFVPIFTSRERAQRALRTVGGQAKQCCVAEMKGEWLFRALTSHPYGAALNPACGCGVTYLDRNAVRKIGDGSILEPFEPGPRAHGKVQIVEPADYPTSFIQPVFRFLRERPEVRAAWLFRQEPSTLAKTYYVFGLLVTGDAEAVKKDLAVVAHAECPPETGFGVTALNAKDPAVADIMAKFPPFYAAPDFVVRSRPV
ncbi:MAG: enhanced serine sensitivity protein SseB C-terminal domain-containing protein [Verrucomicrobia bacterium]|nr:enhanced serine sensitivity protein SseB C-terminal domain-containing protein [Verrucomicrobiota bacterium]